MYIVTLHNKGVSPIEILGDIEKLQSGKVVQGINSIDSFTFSMLPSNVGFALIKDFKTLVKVFNTNTNKTEFVGRSLYTTTEMSENGMITKEVVCESLLGYLCDSVQTYMEEKMYIGGAHDVLGVVISCHNSLVEEEKRFTLRNIADTRGIYCGIQRETTWDTIKKKVLDTEGGELTFEVVGDTIYLDYAERIGEIKTTEIALSRNMKSITRERNPSDYITRLIPLGAKEENSEERLDISSVNGGKIYIDDEAAIEEYGIHVGIQEWDDVTDANNLLSKGRSWLSANSKIPVRYSITALDLALLGLDIDHFEIGNSHPLVNGLIGVDDVARIIKKTIDVCEEVNSTIEIGDRFKTLTEIQQDQKRETVAAVRVIQKVSSDYVSRTDNDQVVRMLNNSKDNVNITGDRMTINNTNFRMDKDGTLYVSAIKVSGGDIAFVLVDGTRVKMGGDEIAIAIESHDYNESTTGHKLELFHDGIYFVDPSTPSGMVTPIKFNCTDGKYAFKLNGDWSITGPYNGKNHTFNIVQELCNLRSRVEQLEQ